MTHNPLFALYIFGRTNVIETIATVVSYKQGHLVLGFQHTCVELVFGFFVATPIIDFECKKITLTGDQWAHTELHFQACLQTIYLPDRHNKGS